MQIKVLRSLELETPLIEGLPSHVAAASGIACAGEWLHVVPDDGLHLATFGPAGSGLGRLHPLFSESPLPLDEQERKKLKPDLESLALVDLSDGAALPPSARVPPRTDAGGSYSLSILATKSTGLLGFSISSPCIERYPFRTSIWRVWRWSEIGYFWVSAGTAPKATTP